MHLVPTSPHEIQEAPTQSKTLYMWANIQNFLSQSHINQNICLLSQKTSQIQDMIRSNEAAGL